MLRQGQHDYCLDGASHPCPNITPTNTIINCHENLQIGVMTAYVKFHPRNLNPEPGLTWKRLYSFKEAFQVQLFFVPAKPDQEHRDKTLLTCARQMSTK